jgi:catechol 2,3-dioxygenase-like lactoylglutathione lyase family enzyme
MHVVGLDHIVVNIRDIERAMHFYHELLGLELLRLEEFRAGKVGFVSARISPETIIDLRPIAAGERVTPNMDHFCLVLGPTDMHRLHAELKAKGIQVEDTVRPAWGAQGYGSSLNSVTLMGTSLNFAVTRDPRRREGRAAWPGYTHWPCQSGRGCARVLRTATVPASMAGIRSPTPEPGPTRHHDRGQEEGAQSAPPPTQSREG